MSHTLTGYTVTRERISSANLTGYLTYASGWACRIWREQSTDSEVHYEPGRTRLDSDVVTAIQRFGDIPTSMLEVAKGILALPRVTRVEIRDMVGMGEVLTKTKA